MTALEKYQRLEASGLWRASPDAQRRDVIVSIGDATLMIADLRDRPLAHWSIPAIERANPGRRPALYHPDGDPGETLELAENEREMVAAIEKLRAAVSRGRPHPGRLRLMMFLLSMAAVAVLLAFWLPDALRSHAVSVVPEVKRAEIGQSLLGMIQRVSGPACRDSEGIGALGRLGQRIAGPGETARLVVLRDGLRGTAHLPGGTILVHRSLIENHEEPDVVAGYILAERLRMAQRDPLDRLLRDAGLWSSFRLLTTAEIRPGVLQSHAERLLTEPPAPLPDAALARAFAAAAIRPQPYARATGVTGETALPATVDAPADPPAEPILSDADWLRLQGICGG